MEQTYRIKKGDWNRYQKARLDIRLYKEDGPTVTADIDHSFITTVEAEYDRAMCYNKYIDDKKFCILIRKEFKEQLNIDLESNQEVIELKAWEK
tara:strand:+ start:2016 stop:2297 length:282 start_codon:yes stop_codon:yes gene_type:complete